LEHLSFGIYLKEDSQVNKGVGELQEFVLDRFHCVELDIEVGEVLLELDVIEGLSSENLENPNLEEVEEIVKVLLVRVLVLLCLES